MSILNIGLNKLDSWIHSCCCICGRSYPNTVLNIEAHIHHHASIICVDQKACRAIATANNHRVVKRDWARKNKGK